MPVKSPLVISRYYCIPAFASSTLWNGNCLWIT